MAIVSNPSKPRGILTSRSDDLQRVYCAFLVRGFAKNNMHVYVVLPKGSETCKTRHFWYTGGNATRYRFGQIRPKLWLWLDHRPNNYKDTKPKMSSLLVFNIAGDTVSHVGIFDPSNLITGSPTPPSPPSLSSCVESIYWSYTLCI